MPCANRYFLPVLPLAHRLFGTQFQSFHAFNRHARLIARPVPVVPAVPPLRSVPVV
jgi:hypothetical protein